MAVRVISCVLTEQSIQRAIQEVAAYQIDLERKVARLRSLIGERIAWSAARGFGNAIATDIFTGNAYVANDVEVRVEDSGDVTVVIADGDEAVFIEFGAGVYYNGAVGASPHPWGAQMGYLIGTYGKGQGRKNVWALPGSTSKNKILTHGTPAAMPMYRGLLDAIQVISDLIREVFQ